MITMKAFKPTPEPTLRRLPRYLHILRRLRDEAVTDVTSVVIAKELNLDQTQVRKDIEYVEYVGKPKVGYNTEELIHAIESFLNYDNMTDAFLVGVGNMGVALMGYKNFANYGFNIIAAFDSDGEKIGKTIHGISILNINKLIDLANRMHIHIGVITTPANEANNVAEMMIKGGIKAIWNFAPTQLKVPKGIIVENTQLSTNVSILKRKLTEVLQSENN